MPNERRSQSRLSRFNPFNGINRLSRHIRRRHDDSRQSEVEPIRAGERRPFRPDSPRSRRNSVRRRQRARSVDSILDEERFTVHNDRSATDSDEDEEDLKKPRSSTAPSGSSNSTQTQEIKLPGFETVRIDNLIQHCSCIICLELPRAGKSVYQCRNGHISCQDCISHIIADSSLKDTKANCPSCRTSISWDSIVRNRTVEMTAQELPQECQFCREKQTTQSIDNHENSCPVKPTECKFKWAGCTWKAKTADYESHLIDCDFRKKTASELLERCKGEIKKGQIASLEKKNILQMLSSNDIAYKDVVMNAYRTDDYQAKLQFQSNDFYLLGSTWQLRGKITSVENHPSRPTNDSDRSIQLSLRLRDPEGDIKKEVEYLIMKAPGSPIDLETTKYYFSFDATNDTAPANKLKVKDEAMYNQIIGSLSFKLRLFLFEGMPEILNPPNNNNSVEAQSSQIRA